MALKGKSEIDQLLEEFRRIGRDSEYCPESEENVEEVFNQNGIKPFKEQYVYSLNAQCFFLIWVLSEREKAASYRVPDKETHLICTFCRKNGELPSFYQSHCLKDKLDKICCPVLWHYVCPICKATGDNAHTQKYCPFNKDQNGIPLISRLKGLRNSMGKRRGRLGY